MKYLSKINRGAILTSIIILGVIIYLVTNSVNQNNEKPRIKQICETYLETQVTYSMLPVKYRVDKPEIPESEFKAYLAEMKKNIIAFYPDKEQYYKFILDNLTGDLTGQRTGNSILFQYTKEIIKFDEFVFDGNSVDVRFTSKTTIETKSVNPAKAGQKEKLTQELQDNIILEKIDGQWKIVYANITRPQGDNFPIKEGYPVVVGRWNG